MSRMVLQRGVNTMVWGQGSLGGAELTAVIDCVGREGRKIGTYYVRLDETDGGWKLWLKPQESGTICEIVIPGTSLELQDVIFGDVWLCSGQSNMEQKMRNINNWENELMLSRNYSNIRFMDLERKQSPKTDDLNNDDIAIPWSDPSNAEMLQNMSAVCFLTARYWYDRLQVPLGLIGANWGGTVIEAWSPREALAECNSPPPKERHCNMTSPATDKIARKNCDSYLWNAMINPLKQNVVKGFLWYQGEANSHTKRRDSYHCTFPALIRAWRTEFSEHSETNSEAPFGFVQLAPFRDDPRFSGFPLLRWHQTADYGYVPNPKMEKVFMAVSIDTYDFTPTPVYNNTGLHPRYKHIIATRLAVAGMNVAYNHSDYNSGGPFPTNISIVGSEIRINYDQNLEYKMVNSSTFFFCSLPLSSCDSSLSQSLWSPISPALVRQSDQRTILISTDQEMKNLTVMCLAFLWRESPVKTYLGSSVYSNDEYALPSPPWKYRIW